MTATHEPKTSTNGAPIGYLDPDDAFTRRFVQGPLFESALEQIDAYELPRTDLTRFPGLVVSSQIDQRLLYRQRSTVRDYLDAGGVVAFSGHLATEWLPGAETFVPRTIDSHEDYTICESTPHPVFDGVEMTDLTHQRGVAGFFARGHNPPPDHASVVLTLPGGEPVVYVDEATTGGTIFAHSGNDLITLRRRNSTAARIPGQLLDWMHEVSTLDPNCATARTTEGAE